MRYVYFLLIFCSTLWLVAQNSLNFESYGHYNSTGVRRQVTDAFFYGGAIDTADINQSLSQLAARNTFGLQMGAGIQWLTPWQVSQNPKKWGSNYRWIVGAGAEQYAGLQFSDAAFALVFRGALPYLGDTLQLSNFRAQATTFSKLGLGLYDTLTKSSFLVHFVAVHQHFDALLSKGIWFQDPSSAQIDLALNGRAQLSNPNAAALGFAFDLDYHFGSSENDLQEQQFQLRIQNLGLARISNMAQYYLNGSLQYAGYTINEWQQTNVNELTSSLLDSLGFEKNNAARWMVLPAQIQLAKSIQWESLQRIQAYYGAQFMLRQTYTPLIYAGAHLKVKKAWQTGIGMAYGGFGGLRAQAYSAFHFKHAQLLLRSDNISLLNGASFYLQYRCDF